MIAIVLSSLLLAQQAAVPSSGNVLATPQPTQTLDPLFVFHATAADRKEGRHLFDTHCTTCHGMNAQGTAQGPPLVNADAQDFDFMLRTGRMPAPVPWEQETHKAPYFTPQQIWDIIAYAMSRSNGDKVLPHVVVPPKNKPQYMDALRTGREVYEENCEQCHAATGHGNNVGYRDVAPSLMDADPQLIADAVRMGPDVMPKFGPNVIDQTKLNDLAAYIEYLQHANYNPGGVQLANWGPISEGFITWAVGISLLVLLARRIGGVE